jgi:RNA polymerase sigma-70 factor (ECF subfamily)
MLDCSRREVLSDLYRKLGRHILDKSLSMVRNRSLAEEVTQDVFLRLFETKARFEVERQAFRWLYQTCHNRCIDILRSKAHAAVDLVASDFWDGIAADADLGSMVRTLQASEQLLAHLPERLAQVLWYIAVDGLTQDEAAELLGVSRATIARDLRDAKERLKEVARD